jgi:hypothetical protein
MSQSALDASEEAIVNVSSIADDFRLDFDGMCEIVISVQVMLDSIESNTSIGLRDD